MPEGEVFANPNDVPQEYKVDPIVQEPLIVKEEEEKIVQVETENLSSTTFSYFSQPLFEQKEEIRTPTEQEALNALYADNTTNINEAQNNTQTNITGEQLQPLVEDKEEFDEETALFIKEQQTKASKLLGIGEFARPRNLLEDPSEVQEEQKTEENSPSNQFSTYTEPQYTQNNVSENINYREALSAFFGTSATAESMAVQQASASHQAEVERIENNAKARHFGDVKQSLYEDGFKLKVYQKANTLNHYYMKFIYSNRINRDTALFTYLVMIIELLVMIIAKKAFGAPITYIIIGAVGVLVPLIPTLVWIMNPTKRIRAQFNLTQSLANSFIAFIIICAITIVVSLLLDVNMKAGTTYVPIIIASNIPIGVVIYSILYKSNNYHLKK